jgi:ketosteroid isomerase-like protein
VAVAANWKILGRLWIYGGGVDSIDTPYPKEERIMSPAENTAIVRSAYEAFARQDIPAVLAAFDSSIEWYLPDELPIGGTFHGQEGVLEFFHSLPGYFDELSVEPETFIAADDHVVVVGQHRGRVNGHPFAIGFAMVWTMHNGKAIRFREYNDSGKLLRIAEH